MTPISRIDLLARRRLPTAGLVLAALAVLVTGWQVQLTLNAYDSLQGHRAGLGALQRPRAAPAPTMTAEDSRRHVKIEALAKYLALPWDDLLGRIERFHPRGATLSRLDIDAGTHQVALVGHVPSVDLIGTYLRAAEADTRLSGVVLREHARTPDVQDGGFDFGLGAEWVDSAAADSEGSGLSNRTATAAQAREVRP